MNTIDPGWILLDNQSKSDVFIKTRLVKNICHSGGGYITIQCNAGKHRVTHESTLKFYGTVWFDKGAISNILYFSSIRYNYSVRYAAEVKYLSIVKPDKELLFRQSPSGLYFHETPNRNVVLINTVLESRE